MHSRRLLLGVCMLLAGCPRAWAHSFAKYVSTPVSPPLGFVWVAILSFVALVALNYVLFRSVHNGSRRRLIVSLLAIPSFALVFLFYGGFAANLSTAPPPGLGLFCPVFWGWGLGEVGGLFLRWNVYGIVFLLFSLTLFGNLWRRLKERQVGRLLLLNVAAYVLCLAPYLFSGALTHGWAGASVAWACVSQREMLESALVEYAEHNGGRLPMAESMHDLAPQILPYVAKKQRPYGNPISVCPADAAFLKNPEGFVWNTALSGKLLGEIGTEQPGSAPSPFWCPFHVDFWRVSGKFEARRLSARYQAPENAPERPDR